MLYRNIRGTKFANSRSMLWSILRLDWSPAPPWCMHHCSHRARLRSATWNHRKWDCPSSPLLLRRISTRYWIRIRWETIPGSSQVVSVIDCLSTPTSCRWKKTGGRLQSVLHLCHRCRLDAVETDDETIGWCDRDRRIAWCKQRTQFVCYHNRLAKICIYHDTIRGLILYLAD